MLGFDAESMSLAGAFILGAILATAATLHLTRSVVSLFERRRRPDDDHRRRRP